MSRELLWVHVGQCGVQLGGELWKLFREDHHIDDNCWDQPPTVAFSHHKTGEFVARNLFIDTDPRPIWDLKGDDRIIPTERHTATDSESSANLYPKGMRSTASSLAWDRARLLLEEADSPSGAVFFYGSGGGTGSGMTTNVSARLFSEYPKMRQVHFVVLPNPGLRSLSTSSVEPYNVGLMANDMSDLTNLCIMADNDALYHISGTKGGFSRPNYSFINRIVSMAVLVTSSGWRFNSCPSVRFEDMPTNLVINPNLKYTLISLAPVIRRGCLHHEQMTTGDLTRELFQTNSYLARCDPRAGAMAACISYRGQVSAVNVCEALTGLAVNRGARFVSWIKPSFKVGITEEPLPCLLGMKLARAACMLSNSKGLACSWSQINWAFRKMFRRKAFLHWYIQEGAEMSDFHDSELNLSYILQQYLFQ